MKTPKPRFDVVGQLGSLRRYARSLTRNDADAEDLVQDTLLRAYERRSGFRHGNTLRGWLLSILHNRFIDVKRSSAVEARTLEAAYSLADVAIDAPVDECDVVLRSVSGRIRTSGVSIIEGSPIRVRVNTVTGGLDLSRTILTE